MLKLIPDYLHSTYKQIEVPDIKEKRTVKKMVDCSIKDWAKKLRVSYPSLVRRVNAGYDYDEIMAWAKSYVPTPRGKNVKYRGIPLVRYCKEHKYNYLHVKYKMKKGISLDRIFEMIDSGEDNYKPMKPAKNKYISEVRGYFIFRLGSKHMYGCKSREEAIRFRNRYLTEKGMEIPD